MVVSPATRTADMLTEVGWRCWLLIWADHPGHHELYASIIVSNPQKMMKGMSSLAADLLSVWNHTVNTSIQKPMWHFRLHERWHELSKSLFHHFARNTNHCLHYLLPDMRDSITVVYPVPATGSLTGSQLSIIRWHLNLPLNLALTYPNTNPNPNP